MDTANKRFSAVNVQSPWRGLGIFPSGAVDQPARYALAYLYSGFEASAELTIDTPGALTVAGQSASTNLSAGIGGGAVGVAGQSLGSNVGLAIGGGAETVAGQTVTTGINLGLTAGSVAVAGESLDLLAEQSFGLTLEAGSVSISGETLSLDAQAQEAEGATGGWLFLNMYEAEQQRRRLRKKEREELERETEQIQNKLDKEIAQLLREQEAKDDKREDYERLAKIAKANADLEQARQYSERVAKAYARVLTQGNYSAIEALDRELQRAREEEEFLVMALLLLAE